MSGVIRFVTDDAGAGASGDTMSENAAAKPASAVAAVAISDVVMGSPQETRVEPVRASSPSWFVARINAVSRIIGSPPGYVGYDEAGQLTEKVRRKPYCVILFDEIEKAHPDVLNILLQILDDGHITDAQGRNVNFENTVIVMTSNAGSDARTSAGSVGFGRTADQQGRERAMKALESFLRPEFINRVDEIVYFNKLTEDNFKAIAAIMLRELQDALKEKGITFTWDDALLDYLVKKSYSMTYGARNLRRQIQKDLEDDIATKLIDSYLHPIQSIHASADGEHPVLTAE